MLKQHFLLLTETLVQEYTIRENTCQSGISQTDHSPCCGTNIINLVFRLLAAQISGRFRLCYKQAILHRGIINCSPFCNHKDRDKLTNHATWSVCVLVNIKPIRPEMGKKPLSLLGAISGIPIRSCKSP